MKVKFFTTTRADRQIALLLFAITLGLYVRTLAPGLLAGDSGEFQVAAWTLGLAHPTGYPLYLLLGSLWQHLLALFGLTPAYALNLLSALFGALTVTTLYLALMSWLQSGLTVRRLAALLAALLLAVNPTFWSQNLIAEVYSLHALFVILILHAAHQLMPLPIPSTTDTTDTIAAALTEPELNAHLIPILALLTGLSLTHHAMTLLLLPSILVALWWARAQWLTPVNIRVWLLSILLVGAPLLLYLYIPLRSGPGPSPWYHQALGTETLTLYQNSWLSFWQFISGQSISVGFRGFNAAMDQLPQAWLLWRLHFLLPGLVMVGLGFYVLWRTRNWRVLALTLPLIVVQQLFNLFYAIGDILVYYIPLYLVAAIWAGFSADIIGGGIAAQERKAEAEQPADERRPVLAVSVMLVAILLWLPIQIARTYYLQIDQSATTAPHAMWDKIVATQLPENAILISNDRNEIVPLFYLQAVEKQLTGVTGLFPLIEPGPRFADIGTTIDTALATASDHPLYLVKPMPGLEIKFALQSATPPLVAVAERPSPLPAQQVGAAHGPLSLLGYDWGHAAKEPAGESTVTLYWQVNTALVRDYTTTVQLFNQNGEKIAQNDAPPGGIYYPTSLWKPGEVLVEQHTLLLATDIVPVQLLVTMYMGSDATQLAAPIIINLKPK